MKLRSTARTSYLCLYGMVVCQFAGTFNMSTSYSNECGKERCKAGRPGSSEVPRNPLKRWDVSSIPANGIFLTKKLKKTKKLKNAQQVEND